jgi:hypothetical protein
VPQKQRESEPTIQFVVNRPEIVGQRKLQELADKSPRVTQSRPFLKNAHDGPQSEQAAQLQAMVDSYVAQPQRSRQKKAHNLPVSMQAASAGVVQCKPKDIRKTHKLKLNKDGAIQNEEADRVDPPVSYPMNTLIALGIINHDDVKGGHLFKREYGGLDNYSNVVTWSERSEDAFTVFEDDYLDKAREGATAAKTTVTYNVKTKASFGEAGVSREDLFPGPNQPQGKAFDTARHKVWRLTKNALETVPTSVDVSLSDLSEVSPFSRDGSKMLDKKVTPSAAAAQNHVNNIVNGIADNRIERALERLKNP